MPTPVRSSSAQVTRSVSLNDSGGNNGGAAVQANGKSRVQYDRGARFLISIGLLAIIFYTLPRETTEEISKHWKIGGIPLSVVGETHLVLSILVLIFFVRYIRTIGDAMLAARADGASIDVMVNPLSFDCGYDEKDEGESDYGDIAQGLGWWRNFLIVALGISTLFSLVFQITIILGLIYFAVFAAFKEVWLARGGLNLSNTFDSPFYFLTILLLLVVVTSSVINLVRIIPPQRSSAKAKILANRKLKIEKKISGYREKLASLDDDELKHIVKKSNQYTEKLSNEDDYQDTLMAVFGEVPEGLRKLKWEKVSALNKFFVVLILHCAEGWGEFTFGRSLRSKVFSDDKARPILELVPKEIFDNIEEPSKELVKRINSLSIHLKREEERFNAECTAELASVKIRDKLRKAEKYLSRTTSELKKIQDS